jgi:hypothetical protein
LKKQVVKMAYNQAYNMQPWQSAGVGPFGNFTVVDKVPQEMLFLVDSHWQQYPPSKTSEMMKSVKPANESFSFTSEPIVAFNPRICHLHLFDDCNDWKPLRDLHLHQD